MRAYFGEQWNKVKRGEHGNKAFERYFKGMQSLIMLCLGSIGMDCVISELLQTDNFTKKL